MNCEETTQYASVFDCDPQLAPAFQETVVHEL